MRAEDFTLTLLFLPTLKPRLPLAALPEESIFILSPLALSFFSIFSFCSFSRLRSNSCCNLRFDRLFFFDMTDQDLPTAMRLPKGHSKFSYRILVTCVRDRSLPKTLFRLFFAQKAPQS
eukprot:c25399_g4_i1 orf=513-869(+)